MWIVCIVLMAVSLCWIGLDKNPKKTGITEHNIEHIDSTKYQPSVTNNAQTDNTQVDNISLSDTISSGKCSLK